MTSAFGTDTPEGVEIFRFVAPAKADLPRSRGVNETRVREAVACRITSLSAEMELESRTVYTKHSATIDGLGDSTKAVELTPSQFWTLGQIKIDETLYSAVHLYKQ
jgi:hypothetical protein